jgi:hypothetical protein
MADPAAPQRHGQAIADLVVADGANELDRSALRGRCGGYRRRHPCRYDLPIHDGSRGAAEHHDHATDGSRAPARATSATHRVSSYPSRRRPNRPIRSIRPAA